jgi:polysaccharide biosynthesis/export protein
MYKMKSLKNYSLLFVVIIFIFSCKSTSNIIEYNPTKNTKNINSDSSKDLNKTDIVYEKIKFPLKTQEEITEELKQLHIRQTQKYTIKIGDIYNIFVDADDGYTTLNAIVKSDGFMSIKRLGEVEIEGLTLEQAKNYIEKKISDYITIPPKVSVIPIKIKESQVNILGEVVRPGIYTIEGKTTLLDIISAAGGVSVLQLQNEKLEIADLDASYIVREDKILPVNFIELIIKANPLHNILLQDKDYIYIPSLSSKQVYIIGEVNKPGNFMLAKNLTVTKLLAQAGGIKVSSSNDVLVIRGNLKNPDVYKVNVSKILNKGSMDFLLQRDDVVYVPKNAITKYNDVIANIMPTLDLLTSSVGIVSDVSSTYLNIDDIRKRIKHYPEDYPKE